MLNLKPSTYWSLAGILLATLTAVHESGLLSDAVSVYIAQAITLLTLVMRQQSPQERAQAESLAASKAWHEHVRDHHKTGPLAMALGLALASTQLTACAHGPAFEALPRYAMAGLAQACDLARQGANEALKARLVSITAADTRMDEIDATCDQAESAIVQLDGAAKRLGAVQ